MIQHEIIALYRQGNQFGKLIDMEYDVLEDGTITHQIKISEKHLATPVAAHGGVLSALADSTLGVAALAVSAKDGNVVSTVEFKITYMRPVIKGDIIEGIPRVRQAGKKIIFVEADFVNQNGELVGIANGTFNQYPATKIFNV